MSEISLNSPEPDAIAVGSDLAAPRSILASGTAQSFVKIKLVTKIFLRQSSSVTEHLRSFFEKVGSFARLFIVYIYAHM